MIKLKIKLLAYNGAHESIYKSAIKRVDNLILPENYIIVENDPDILFFLTGGSELSAISSINKGGFYLLIGSKHDNSYSSATEVKASLNSKKITSILLDEEEIETKEVLNDFYKVKLGLFMLNNKRLGQIGKVSDWLISSTIPKDILDSKLGIKLIEIPWSNVNHFSSYVESEYFLKAFEGKGDIDLRETSKVNEMLVDIVDKWKLDAITVECFPLVQNEGVTACLPLSLFNDSLIPAGCEGDITAVTGMMLGKEIIGTIPWIANINKVTDDFCLFSHCTIAKSLVDDYTINTHFETGKGSAIAGDFKGDIVTIFRLDNLLTNAFIASSYVVDRPKYCTACRTQIHVILSKMQVKLLKDSPLGNHHLIFPGNQERLLKLMCNMLNINIL